MRQPNDQSGVVAQMKAKTMKTNHDLSRTSPAIRTLKIPANKAHTNARDVHFPQTPENSFGVHLSYRHRTMRAVVCALWVLTTASGAHAAASLTWLYWMPSNPHSFYYNTTGVSGDGSVVVGTGGIQPYEGGNLYYAFRWTASTGMVGLGYPPVGILSSAAGVSADGSIVIGCGYTRWTAGSGMQSLWDELVTNGPEEDPDWGCSHRSLRHQRRRQHDRRQSATKAIPERLRRYPARVELG